MEVPNKRATQSEVNRWNEAAYKIYRDHMAMCPRCGRKFEPDRLSSHLRGCHATGHFKYGASGDSKQSSHTSSQPKPKIGHCDECHHSCYYCKKRARTGTREIDGLDEDVPPAQEQDMSAQTTNGVNFAIDSTSTIAF
jgi:hypothetical protein